MRDYTNFPDEVWVKVSFWENGELYRYVGFVVGYNKERRRYRVSIPEIGHKSEEDFIEFQKHRLTSMCIDEGVEEDLINFTLDQGKKEWFMELTGGEASGTDEKLLRPFNGD